MNPDIAMAAAQVGLSAIVQMFNSYQGESTRRQWVRDHHRTLLEKVRIEQENLLRYYEMKFSERKVTLEEFYWLLREAVQSGNDVHLQSALYGILDVIKTDPLSDYDQFVRAYQDPDIRLEI